MDYKVLLPVHDRSKADGREDQSKEEILDSGESRFFPELHGLRGLAALSIAFGHAYPANPYLRQGSILGFIAFLMLSGHLITGILLKTSGLKKKKKAGWLLFSLSRVVRIYPALLITTLYASIARVQLGHNASRIRSQAVSALLQVENLYVTKHGGGFLSHTWYLGMEQQFYIIWPFFVLFMRPRGKAVRAAGCGLVLSLHQILQTRGTGYIDQGWFGAFLPWRFLILGGAMQLLGVPAIPLRLVKLLPWLGLTAGCVQIGLGEWLKKQEQMNVGIWTGPIIMFCIIHGSISGGNFVLRHESLVFLGRISYAYFLYHVPLMKNYGAFTNNSVLGGWIAVGTVVPATLSTLYLEEPLRDYVKMRIRGSTSGS